MADDTTLGEVTMLKGWYAFFSPDGGLMNSFPNDVTEVRETWPAYVHDVASGTSFEFPTEETTSAGRPTGTCSFLAGDTVRVSKPCRVPAPCGLRRLRLGEAEAGRRRS